MKRMSKTPRSKRFYVLTLHTFFTVRSCRKNLDFTQSSKEVFYIPKKLLTSLSSLITILPNDLSTRASTGVAEIDTSSEASAAVSFASISLTLFPNLYRITKLHFIQLKKKFQNIIHQNFKNDTQIAKIHKSLILRINFQ